MFSNIKVNIKYYKVMGGVLYLTGLTLLALYQMGPQVFHHDFLSGFATGLLIVAVGLTVIYLVRRKDEDFESDLEVSFQDERVINERRKIRAIAGQCLLYLLTIMVTVSVFYEFSFSIGGTILLWFYILVYLGLKIYSWIRKGI